MGAVDPILPVLPGLPLPPPRVEHRDRPCAVQVRWGFDRARDAAPAERTARLAEWAERWGPALCGILTELHERLAAVEDWV